MLKIKKVWEEYKVPIIIVGGICATVVGYKYYGKLKALILLNGKIQSGQSSLLESVTLDDFPLDMPISEIKAILTERGVEFKDALVTILDGREIFFTR
jgi:hypothetical protein